MKGIVFTEFLDFVAEQHDEDTVDDIIDANTLPSGGAYTSVGTYNHEELGLLCQTLAEHTGTPPEQIVKDFGFRLSSTFAKNYADFFSRCNHYFDFLESIEEHIHKEVRKLYPDAELPTFVVRSRTDTCLIMEYTSPRHFSALALGLLEGTARHFNKKVQIKSEACAAKDTVRFIIDMI